MTKLACAYIGLGSNLKDPAKQLQSALDSLATHAQIAQVQSSPWYCSRAIGPGNQPDYLNAVAKIQTSLSPQALLEALQAIEDKQGRTRKVRWGARTLDLDILLYDQLILGSDKLTIPHPQMYQRSFVLKPLADLSPALCLPDGETLSHYLALCDCSDLTPFESV